MTVQEELKQFDKQVKALVAKQKRNEKRITGIQSENHALSIEISSLLNQQHMLFINTH
jgi:peptidoglycan hydrolase CwlO-like protein